jgi:uncharacterized damage-inducible protein DinB
MDIQKELIAEYDSETIKTRQMLDAIPADADFTWKPHTKSMPMGRLAGHIAELAGTWAVSVLTADKLEHAAQSYIPVSKAVLLERFDREVAEAKTALAGFTLQKWDGNWKFLANGKAWLDNTKYFIWRNCVLNHMIHHRAQLGVYLRLLNKPIPGTYGPSADSK